jgi:hypothetical protein
MGLAERRAAKAFETTHFPRLKAEIDGAAGFEVPVEVAWDQLSEEGYAHLYDEAWPKVYFTPLVEALRAITVDDLGREALRAGLTRIVIKNVGGYYYGETAVSFEGGVLTIDHKPCTNIDYGDERRQAIQKLLESKL